MEINTTTLGIGAFAFLIWFYWFRVERVKRVRMLDKLSQTESQQLKHSTRYPFVNSKDELWNPAWWSVDAMGYDREGTYGITRRDYAGVGGTTIISHSDSFTNV